MRKLILWVIIFVLMPGLVWAAAPSVTHSAPEGVWRTKIYIGGNVTDDGGKTITERGICYSASTNPPTTSDTTITTTGTTGVFTLNITGLTQNTTYYCRAYAINEEGTGYGDAVTVFTAPHYVSYSGGNDSNNGSQATPWQTLYRITQKKSCEAYLNRTETWFADYGDYNYLTVPAVGSADYPIIFGAYGSGDKPKVYVWNSTPLTTWSGPDGNGCYYKSVASCNRVYEDGHYLGREASDATCVDGYWYHDDVGDVLYYKRGATDPDVVIITYAPGNHIGVNTNNDATYFTVENIEFVGGYISTGALNADVSDIAVKDCVISEGGCVQIITNGDYRNDNITITGNTFNYCANPTLKFHNQAYRFGTNIEVGDNQMLNCNTTYFDGPISCEAQRYLNTTLNGATETAIVCSTDIPGTVSASGTLKIKLDSDNWRTLEYSSWTGATFTISATDFSGDNATAGNMIVVLDLDSDAVYTQNMVNYDIHDNEISGLHSDWYGGGIHIWIGNSTIGAYGKIRNNFVHDLGGDGILHSGTYTSGEIGTTRVEIYNNIITRTGLAGAGGGEFYGMNLQRDQCHATPSEVYNNTIRDCLRGIKVGSGSGYYTLRNNTVSATDSYLIYCASLSGITFDYNNYYPDGAAKFYYSGNKTFSQWQSAISGDAASITTDPAFINAGGSFALDTDFQIPVTSDCADGGTTPLSRVDYGGRTITDDWIGAWGYWARFPAGTPIPMSGYTP